MATASHRTRPPAQCVDPVDHRVAGAERNQRRGGTGGQPSMRRRFLSPHAGFDAEQERLLDRRELVHMCLIEQRLGGLTQMPSQFRRRWRSTPPFPLKADDLRLGRRRCGTGAEFPDNV